MAIARNWSAAVRTPADAMITSSTNSGALRKTSSARFFMFLSFNNVHFFVHRQWYIEDIKKRDIILSKLWGG